MCLLYAPGARILTSPWEFVLHYSGANQVEYAQSQSELLSALNRRLQEESAHPTDQKLASLTIPFPHNSSLLR
jgi:hypothetical protein